MATNIVEPANYRFLIENNDQGFVGCGKVFAPDVKVSAVFRNPGFVFVCATVGTLE